MHIYSKNKLYFSIHVSFITKSFLYKKKIQLFDERSE